MANREITTHLPGPIYTQPREITIEVTDDPAPGKPHSRYLVTGQSADGMRRSFLSIEFQKGPVAKNDVNGLTDEVLLAIVADRLESIQIGPSASHRNAAALMAVQFALGALHNQTRDRIKQRVEGKSEA